MIGIVICAADQDGIFDEAIFHKYGDRTVFEISIDNALKSEMAHRVVICCPVSQRTKIHGAGIMKPLVRPERTFLGRKATLHFYNESEGLLGGVYGAALLNGLDHVIIMHANSPLLPTWLINNMISDYFCKTNHNGVFSNFNDDGQGFGLGFRLQITPFWILAQENIYSEDKSRISFSLKDLYGKNFVLNTSPSESCIHGTLDDLRFTSTSNIERFDFLISETDIGADIGELIKELYDK